jgi:hypothetical protein
MDYVQNWSSENGMQLIIHKTSIISFICKTNSIKFDYKFYNNFISYSQCVKDLKALMDCKLYFHYHNGHTFSQGLKMLGLI